MTHTEATSGVRGPGIHLSTCPGELVPIETRPDTCWDGRLNRAVERSVTVYRCPLCHRRVSIATGPDGAIVLNDYALAGRLASDSLVRELASAWDAKPMLPQGDDS